MLRFYFVVASFMAMTTLLIATQWSVLTLRLPGHGRIALAYYALLRRLLRIRIRVVGRPLTGKPVLIVANHSSWTDIPALGSVMPLAFIAKQEVRNWPLVGRAAELHHTIFVDRSRRQQTTEVNARIAQRMNSGYPVVLFAEGTSNDGNRVLPFRSALVGAASQVLEQNGGGQEVWLQPLAISYPRLDGLPLGRQHRPLVAWYGDMDFVPHLRDFVRLGSVEAVLTFGEPVAFDGLDRKKMVKNLEKTVRQMIRTALRAEFETKTA